MQNIIRRTKKLQLFPYLPSHPKFQRIFELARERYGIDTYRYIGNDGERVHVQSTTNAAINTINIKDL
jgi:hypothetical protein